MGSPSMNSSVARNLPLELPEYEKPNNALPLASCPVSMAFPPPWTSSSLALVALALLTALVIRAMLFSSKKWDPRGQVREPKTRRVG